jgi:hypothetical protein
MTLMNKMKRDLDLSFKFAYDRTVLRQIIDEDQTDSEDLVDYVINKM